MLALLLRIADTQVARRRELQGSWFMLSAFFAGADIGRDGRAGHDAHAANRYAVSALGASSSRVQPSTGRLSQSVLAHLPDIQSDANKEKEMAVGEAVRLEG